MKNPKVGLVGCSNLKVKKELPVLGKGGAGGPVNDVRKERHVWTAV